jgi:hypothetical protein
VYLDYWELNDNVRITYHLEAEDYYQAWLARSARDWRRRQWVHLFGAVCCFGIAARMLYSGGAGVRAGTGVFFMGLVLCIFHPVDKWQSSISFKKSCSNACGRAVPEAFILDISSNGIQCFDPVIR